MSKDKETKKPLTEKDRDAIKARVKVIMDRALSQFERRATMTARQETLINLKYLGVRLKTPIMLNTGCF